LVIYFPNVKAAPMFLQTYSGQNVDWSQAVREVLSGNGEIFPAVIRSIRKDKTDGALTYGFFYRKGAEYWDLYFDRAHKPKTTPSIDRVMLEMVNLYGDNAYSFMIPVLNENNLVKTGGFDTRIHNLCCLER
jgi:hypothetical protein